MYVLPLCLTPCGASVISLTAKVIHLFKYNKNDIRERLNQLVIHFIIMKQHLKCCVTASSALHHAMLCVDLCFIVEFVF